MGVKTTMSGLSYAASHIAAAEKAGQAVPSLHQSILLQVTELTRSLNVLVNTMQTGDSNIATINAQITALS